MDQKPMRLHHCDILRTHNLYGFNDFMDFSNLKLKCLCQHWLEQSHEPSSKVLFPTKFTRSLLVILLLCKGAKTFRMVALTLHF